MKLPKREEDTAEISMSPMIDMVFLLLVFFLVSAKPIKPEADLGLTLPGTVEQSESLDLPDEQRIQIQPNGQVVLNEQPIDTPDSKQLPTLLEILTKYKRAADASKSEALVTLDPADEVLHQRIAEVMDACAKANITGVTFAGAEEEEEF